MQTQTCEGFILPSLISNSKSALFAKNLLWVANIMSLLGFFWLSKSWKISFAVFKSRLPVGSSARIISGSLIIALAIATLCDSPPDNWEGKWFYPFDKPIFFNKFSAFEIAKSLLLFKDKFAK